VIPLHDAVSGALAEVMAKAPLSDGKIRFAWRAAVGPALDRASAVRLLSKGVLSIDVATEPWRRELERSRQIVLKRLAELLGVNVVRRLDVRVRTSRLPLSDIYHA
jgi:predicted nucleic acid-binding Zn ribbon protein